MMPFKQLRNFLIQLNLDIKRMITADRHNFFQKKFAFWYFYMPMNIQ